MSGHSKWSQIKRQKGLTDQKRGAVFTKLGYAITIAAKEGGGDLTANFRLRLAIDKAKAANMPKDNIDRAVKRGTGELSGGELFELRYEAFAPGGIGIIINAISDNKNRTASEVKHVLNKHNATLGAQGSVSWQFNERGVMRISQDTLSEKQLSSDEISMSAIDAGAEDVIDDNGDLVIYTTKESLQQIQEALESKSIPIEYAEVENIADNNIEVSPDEKEKLQKLFDAIDELDDVSDFYHNANM